MDQQLEDQKKQETLLEVNSIKYIFKIKNYLNIKNN